MASSARVVHSDPEILGGTPVDYIEHGYSFDGFLDAFPSVAREQAVAALEAAHEALTARAHPAG
jgi:uncharacterized protein (DUF433 family)